MTPPTISAHCGYVVKTSLPERHSLEFPFPEKGGDCGEDVPAVFAHVAVQKRVLNFRPLASSSKYARKICRLRSSMSSE